MTNDVANYTDMTMADRRLRRVIREEWRKGARRQRREIRARKAAWLLACLEG